MTGGPVARPSARERSAGREAAAFSRYLIGAPARPDLADRYARACQTLFPEPPSEEDASLLAFALRHPRLIPALDAAAALVRPGALLRRKILVMAAILEATTEHAERFLPRARSPVGFIITVLRVGVAGGFQAALGLPLLALAQRARA